MSNPSSTSFHFAYPAYIVVSTTKIESTVSVGMARWVQLGQKALWVMVLSSGKARDSYTNAQGRDSYKNGKVANAEAAAYIVQQQ